MTSRLKMLRVAALAVMVVAGAVAQAAAATVSIVPGTQTVNVGDPVVVDLVVSGLTEDIGGFSAIVSFNDTILSGVSFANDPDNHFSGEFDASFGFTGGDNSPLDLFLVGAPVGQGTGFTLARINFLASAAGLSPLTLSGVVLSTAVGQSDIFPTVVNGEVCVQAAATAAGCARVPEPGLLALLGAGVSALAVRRRRAARSDA